MARRLTSLSVAMALVAMFAPASQLFAGGGEASTACSPQARIYNVKSPPVVFTQLREGVEAYRRTLAGSTDQWGNVCSPGYVSALRPDAVPEPLARFLAQYYAKDPLVLIACSAGEAAAMAAELAEAQAEDRAAELNAQTPANPVDPGAPAPSPGGGSNQSEDPPDLGGGDNGGTTPTPTPPPEPAPPPAPAPSSDLSQAEHELLRLVNEARAGAGLATLGWRDDVAAVARAHAEDMIARNFFDHINPDGKSPEDRLAAAGIRIAAGGENVHWHAAAGQDAATIARVTFEGYRESPPHWANIMSTAFTDAGMGFARASDGRVFNAQVFTK